MKRFEIIPGCVDYVPNFLAPEVESALFVACTHAYNRFLKNRFDPWVGHPFAPPSRIPVRVTFMRSSGTWSGDDFITPRFEELRARTRDLIDVNSVLMNLYPDGNTSLGYHRDPENELGEEPTILTLSMGTTRRLELRPQADTRQLVELSLEPGSLFIMKGRCQLDWYHGIVEEPEVTAPRISLTLREVKHGVQGDH